MIWLPADNDGCRFSHHRRQRGTNHIKTRGVDRKILLSSIIYNILLSFFVCDLARRHGWAARMLDRVDPSTATMLGVFLPVLQIGVVLWFSSCDVTRLSYVAVGTKKTIGEVRYVT